MSRLSTTQAVGRDTPRAAACLAVVSHPAAINAWRISASFEVCFAFALDWTRHAGGLHASVPYCRPRLSKHRVIAVKAPGRGL